METQTEPTLIPRLRQVSELWATTNGVKLSRLGRAVANDGAAIQRLSDGRDIGTVKLGRFTAFLADPQNWPDGSVPPEAAELNEDVCRKVSA